MSNTKTRPLGTMIQESHATNVSQSKNKQQKHGKGVYKYQSNYGCNYHHLYDKNKYSTTNQSRKHKLETYPYHKCGIFRHLVHTCWTFEYFVKMF